MRNNFNVEHNISVWLLIIFLMKKMKIIIIRRFDNTVSFRVEQDCLFIQKY